MKLIFSDQPLSEKDDKPSIFLAGPSPRDKSIHDWRDDAFKIFDELGFDGRLFVPRPSSGPFQDYDGQVDWELHHLFLADCIMFWVPRDLKTLPGFTTNYEAGLFIRSPKIVYGRPDEAPNNRYFDSIYRRFQDREPANDLKETIVQAIKRSKFMM
jgi:hypothetical protein